MWLLNGQPLIDSTVTTGTLSKRLAYLNIDSVDDHHMGNYSCVASNMAGLVVQTDQLIVNGIY